VDLLAPDREIPAPDVFRYQWAATERYCAELAGEGTEASHLSCIVRAAGEAHASGNITLIAPALFAYAMYLEQESHFDEAEDALQTMIDVGRGRLRPVDTMSALMRLGRVRRKQAEFDRADDAYTEAGKVAAEIGDQESMLRSRIGRCNVIYFRGNLAEAELGWKSILADAKAARYHRIIAEAEHGLGNLLNLRGRPHEGAPHLWHAYELYDDQAAKNLVLTDLGIVLLRLGHVEAAEAALNEVVRRELVADSLTNALIELMNCASYRRDRVSFERWRERCAQHLPNAAPNIRSDFFMKVGIGFVRFGNVRKGETELRRAHEIATAHGLHELAFRIEPILKGITECGAPDEIESTAPAPAYPGEAVNEVSASLAALAVIS
jgi:tetratricopeptide (TPR) repeat protein